MEGEGGTDQKQGSNVTTNRKTPGTGRQRTGSRLSPGKPWRKQHNTKAKNQTKLQTSEKHQPPKQQKNTKKDKHKNLKMFHMEQ